MAPLSLSTINPKVLQCQYVVRGEIVTNAHNLQEELKTSRGSHPSDERIYLLLDIMDEINNLHLDVVSVQSSTVHGMLILTLKSKFRGAAVAPVRMIKQALRKIGCI